MNSPHTATSDLAASDLFGVLARARAKMKQVASDVEQLRLILTDEHRQWQMQTALLLKSEGIDVRAIAKQIGLKTAATEKMLQVANQLRTIADRYPPNTPPTDNHA